MIKTATRCVASLLLALPALGATTRTPPKAKLISSAPYPPEARKKNVEGNVVLTGEISADGKVTGLKVLASSSPLLEQAALQYVSRWSYSSVATVNGKPTAIQLNTVAHFVKDRAKANDPVSLPSPIAGNVALYPLPVEGKVNTAYEGFPVEVDDRGIAGVLDLDLPGTFSPKQYVVDITDIGPTGKTTLLLERTVQGTSRSSSASMSFSHPISASSKDEKGLHTVRVTVDGANAGGGQYRVGPKRA
jgi:TonB family protein